MREHEGGRVTPLVSFVTPTVGRDTLARTAGSVLAQTDHDWEWIIADDADPATRLDRSRWAGDLPHVWRYSAGRTGSAGLTRNAAIAHALGDWVAFVDDDDALHPGYVERLRGHHDDGLAEVVVFGMRYRDGRVLPDPAEPWLEHGRVGISFAVRGHWLADWRGGLGTVVRGGGGKYFVREDLARPGRHGNEDICLLKDLEEAGARISVDPRVSYYVRHCPREHE